MLAPGDLSDFQRAVQHVLKRWHSGVIAPSPLSECLVFRQRATNEARSPQEAMKQVIVAALARLAERFPTDAFLLDQSYIARAKVRSIAAKANLGESTLYRHKRVARYRLAAEVMEMELAARQLHREDLWSRLPPLRNFYAPPVDAQVKALANVIASGRAPWITALSGMGGVGKTTLANALARYLIAQDAFEEVLWIQVTPERFASYEGVAEGSRGAITVDTLLDMLAVRLGLDGFVSQNGALRSAVYDLLKQRRALVVVDGLHTRSDVKSILRELRYLADPSVFVITVRMNLFGVSDVFAHRVSEFEPGDAVVFIRHEAGRCNLPELAIATDAQLNPILEVVGRNPRAIRLFLSRAQLHGITTALAHFRTAQGKQVRLFLCSTFVDSWLQLDEASRAVLVSFRGLDAVDETQQRISDLSGVEQSEVVDALDNLIRLNLVERSREADQCCYHAPSLTRTFLANLDVCLREQP